MITTFAMDNLRVMIDEIRNLKSSYQESDELNLFFGTMKRFNQNHPLPQEITRRMEAYFNYRWLNDKNIAISTRTDQELLE